MLVPKVLISETESTWPGTLVSVVAIPGIWNVVTAWNYPGSRVWLRS